MGKGDVVKIPPPEGEGDRDAQRRGGGVSASSKEPLTMSLAPTLIPLHRFAVPLPFQGRSW